MTLLPYLKYAVPLGLLSLALPSHAKPIAPAIFCQVYSASETCAVEVSCQQCHTAAPELNSYGQTVQMALGEIAGYTGDNFAENLPAALVAAAVFDSDADDETNGEEIIQGSEPFSAASNSQTLVPDANLEWNAEYALQRVMVGFCGHSPRYDHKLEFLKAADKAAAVHNQLSECLASDYWLQEGLQRLADKRIRPLYELGVDGAIGIGNYLWDYRLFSYVLSNDNDSRDLLLANYHIDEAGNKITAIIERERLPLNEETGQLNLGSGQPLISERRVGMISTQWFMSYFTMFAQVPRNTASQAYRAYLGLDIAKGEGLMPVADEPRDVDAKGVAAPQCAVCHSTLDPLAYAFSAYVGIISDQYAIFSGNPYGTYDATRTEWEGDSYLFGKPVMDLNDWAQQAANSDEFKKNIANMFFSYAVGAEPSPTQKQEFNALWQTMPEDNYSANKLIHRLVDTLAFGGK